VDAIGAGVKGWKLGDRVGVAGTAATAVTAIPAAADIRHVPDDRQVTEYRATAATLNTWSRRP